MSDQTARMPSAAAGETDPAPPAPPYPSALRAWAAVLLLLVIYTFSFIDRQVLALMVGPIKADLAITDLEFGMLTGLSFALFYTFFGIPFARIADSRSRRGLIAFGVALWSLATAASAFARGFGHLFAARVGVGIGEATLTPAANSMISDIFPPEKRGRAISVYTLGIPLGSALAFLFGGAIVEWASTADFSDAPLLEGMRAWQVTFLIVGLPGLLLAAMMFLLREPVRRGKPKALAGTLPPRATARYFLLRWRVYVLSFIGIAFLSALGYGTIYFIGAYFGRIHGFTAGETGLAFGLILLVFGTGGILTAGVITDRWVRAGRSDAHLRVLIVSVLCGAPAALTFPLMDSPAAAIALLSLSIFFNNWVWGTAYAGVAAASPNELRGQATAIYLFIVNLIGLGLGPTLFGFFTTTVFEDEMKIDLAYICVAAIALPIALGCLLAARPAFARQFAEVRAREATER